MSSWNGMMSTTGWRVGTRITSQPRSPSAAAASADRFDGPPLPLEHEAAHALVDRGEVPVQELLEQVRLGGGVDALTELQRRLLRGRPIAACTRDHEAAVVREGKSLPGEPLGDRVRKP